MKIGKINLSGNMLLAPMAGYTDVCLRRLMAENGAVLTVTEMVSVKGLLYENEKTASLLAVHNAETIRCAQLFGSVPDDFFRCAQLPVLADFDIIDVNMGCPVKKVAGNGEGSALIGRPEIAAAIVRALKSAGRTVTVKTRLGIADKRQILDFAPLIEDAGADAIALHCRTTQDMYRGKADYSVIPLLKKRLKIPLIVNGDITDKESYAEAASIGADGVMIGRGAIINPAIFIELRDGSQPDLKKRLSLQLVDYMTDYYGAEEATVLFRKYLPYLLHGIKGGRDLRQKMNFSRDVNALRHDLGAILE